MGEVCKLGVGAVRSGLRARRWSVPALLASSALLVGLLSGCKPTPESLVGTTTRVSLVDDGSQSPYGSGNGSALSADGRYVAFMGASTLVPGATNLQMEILVRDRVAGTTTRASVASDGTQGDDESYSPTISRDGRYVAFSSKATNLVPGDTNGVTDVFVHDRLTGATERVSVASDGSQGTSDAYDITPSISDDGRYVVFASGAPNLLPSGAPVRTYTFIRDRATGTTEPVYATAGGVPVAAGGGATITGDGRFVCLLAKTSSVIPGSTVYGADVFILDRDTGVTSLVSAATDGSPAGSSGAARISGGGRYVVFTSNAATLVPGGTDGQNVYARDLVTGVTSLVSARFDGAADDSSFDGSISDDGRYATFTSTSLKVLSGDPETEWYPDYYQVYVRDLVNGVTARISAAPDGTIGDGLSVYASISGNGRVVAFESQATNLVADDTNSARDVFVNERPAP